MLADEVIIAHHNEIIDILKEILKQMSTTNSTISQLAAAFASFQTDLGTFFTDTTTFFTNQTTFNTTLIAFLQSIATGGTQGTILSVADQATVNALVTSLTPLDTQAKALDTQADGLNTTLGTIVIPPITTTPPPPDTLPITSTGTSEAKKE
jgi:hypothetical protein